MNDAGQADRAARARIPGADAAGQLHRNALHCEGCGLKAPSFGLPAEGKVRCCSDCAKAHMGVVNVSKKKCEGCGLNVLKFGTFRSLTG